MRKKVKIGNANWSYLDSGSGDELWIAFHGYGQEAEVMHHFMTFFRPDARILSFDLPLHGNTSVNSESLRNSDLPDLLGSLTREHGVQKCSLVGFSLGGKVVLKLVEWTPGLIERIMLIAPDGLRVNPIYNFATNTRLGRQCFRMVINFPQPFFGISWLLSTLRLMHKRIHEFVSNQMGSKEKRERVFQTWQMFKHIKPNLKEVRSKISRYQIKPTLVFGKHDKVINPKLAKKLSGQNCKTADVILLDTGHNLLTRENAEYLQDKIH